MKFLLQMILTDGRTATNMLQPNTEPHPARGSESKVMREAAVESKDRLRANENRENLAKFVIRFHKAQAGEGTKVTIALVAATA